jgi:hypothetical protein
MKKFFTGVLILNFLVEAMAAVALIAGAGTLMDAGQDMAAIWTRNYGFAVIAIGSAIFWIWPHRDNLKVVTAVVGMVMTFHICLTISLLLGSQMGTAGLHGVLAILFITLFTQRKKLCAE